MAFLGQRDIAQHIGFVVDLAVRPERATTITVDRNGKKLAAALDTLLGRVYCWCSEYVRAEFYGDA